jgi:Spy/CpxP family protein refolding chaperone
MIDLQRVQKYGLLVAAGLFCLSLTAAAQVSAVDKGVGVTDRDKGSGSFVRPGNCPAAWQAGKTWAQKRHHHYRMVQSLRQLNLTDTQKTAIHEIRISAKKNMIQERADLKIAKIELGEQLHKDSVDMSVVEAQLKKIESLRTAMKLDAIKARAEIKNKLTPEQRKKLAELMQNPPQSNT